MQASDRLSPRGRLIPPIIILHQTRKWTVAEFGWDKNPKVMGICWNGDPDDPNDKGNPRSHSQGTWFIVPNEIAQAIRLCRLAIDVACKYLNQQDRDMAA
jgi:hypothetical protein